MRRTLLWLLGAQPLGVVELCNSVNINRILVANNKQGKHVQPMPLECLSYIHTCICTHCLCTRIPGNDREYPLSTAKVHWVMHMAPS